MCEDEEKWQKKREVRRGDKRKKEEKKRIKLDNREREERRNKTAGQSLPLHCENTAHGGGGRGCGRLFDHPCGGAVGGGRCGGDGQTHRHALLYISLTTTKRKQRHHIVDFRSNLEFWLLCWVCEISSNIYLSERDQTRSDQPSLPGK